MTNGHHLAKSLPNGRTIRINCVCRSWRSSRQTGARLECRSTITSFCAIYQDARPGVVGAKGSAVLRAGAIAESGMSHRVMDMNSISDALAWRWHIIIIAGTLFWTQFWTKHHVTKRGCKRRRSRLQVAKLPPNPQTRSGKHSKRPRAGGIAHRASSETESQKQRHRNDDDDGDYDYEQQQ